MKGKTRVKIIGSILILIISLFFNGCDNTETDKIIKSCHSKFYSTKIVDGEIQKDTLFFEDFEYYDTAGISMYRLVLFGGYNKDTIWSGTEKKFNGKTYKYNAKGELVNIKVIRNDTTFLYDEDEELEQYIIEDEKGAKELIYDMFKYVFIDRKLDDYGNIVYHKTQSTYIFTEDDYKRLNADEIAKREKEFNNITITENKYEYY